MLRSGGGVAASAGVGPRWHDGVDVMFVGKREGCCVRKSRQPPVEGVHCRPLTSLFLFSLVRGVLRSRPLTGHAPPCQRKTRALQGSTVWATLLTACVFVPACLPACLCFVCMRPFPVSHENRTHSSRIRRAYEACGAGSVHERPDG